jgi:drug/metabolite transporter (DMT)-like permease
MNRAAWAMLIALSQLWGGSFFFVAVAVKELPPLTIVALRLGGAAVALNVCLAVLGQRLPTSWATWGRFFAMGVLNNVVPFSLLVWGQTQIASGLAAILNAGTPVMTVILAHVLTDDEKLTVARLCGAGLGVAGTAVMVGLDVLATTSGTLLAQAACVGATISYALASIYGRRFKTLGLSPLVAATGQVTAAAIVLIPIAATVEQAWSLPPPNAQTWMAILGIALLSTALAYILYFRILAVAGATNLMLVALLMPVSALILGALFLGERLTTPQLVGFGLIALGLACIDGRTLRWLRPARSG